MLENLFIQYSDPPWLVDFIPPQGIRGFISNVSEFIITLAVFIFLANSKAFFLSLQKIALLNPCLFFSYRLRMSLSELNFLTHRLEQNLGLVTSLFKGCSLIGFA